MGRIFKVTKSFLKEHFDADGLESMGDNTLAFRLEDEEGREWGCLAVAEEEAEQLMFYSVLLEPAPEDRRADVMLFVTLANYGMQVGNFELDVADGEVRFKTSIDVEDIELTHELCRNVVDLNLMMMGVYFDGLMKVVEGMAGAAEAIAEIEDQDEDDEDDEDDDE